MKRLSPSELRIAEAIDGGAMLARVQEWCAINSGSGNLPGLEAMAARLADGFAVLPGELTLEAPAPVSAIDAGGQERAVQCGRHLLLRVRPEATRRVLLTGHMDTVFGADHPFQTLHWLDAETLGGPGVADMKGGLAVMLAALTAFETSEAAPALGYDVLINADEETGSLSSAPLIARLAQGKIAALTYEPASLPDGTLAGERPGSANISLVVTGRAAHAGRNPGEGRNALVAAAALVLGLKALERDGLTINPARIDGGSANNVVPDKAVLRFNARVRTMEIETAFQFSLNSLIEHVASEHEVSIHRHGGTSRPPKPLDPASLRLFHLVRDCGEALGQPIRWQPSGGVCDGNNIAACGVPVVDTLGVRGGAIHSSDEYLIVPSLAERAALSALVLHRLALGETP